MPLPEPPTRRSGPAEAASRITTAKQDHRQPTDRLSQDVDTDRLNLGLAQVDSLASVFAASVLCESVWRFDDLELRLAAIRLLDTATRNITVAVAR